MARGHFLLLALFLFCFACGDTAEEKFLECARRGDCAAITSSIRSGIDPNTKDRYGATALMEAARYNHLEILRTLLDSTADVNAHDAFSNTALLFATRQNNLDATRLLLERGAIPEPACLLHAAEKGNALVLAALIEHAPDSLCETGPRCLVLAALNNHIDTVNLLLDKGVNPNTPTTCLPAEIPLLAAALAGHADTAGALLEKGADINKNDRFGRTALMMASASGHADVAKLLLDNGADVNTQAEDGWTALKFAEDAGNADIVRLLLNYGADNHLQSISAADASTPSPHNPTNR